MNDVRLERSKDATDRMRREVGILAVVAMTGFSVLGYQLTRLESRQERVGAGVNAIPMRLSDEFLAMRLGTAAQTSAIANSATAVKQA